jgi:hypothetical protein
MSSDTEIDQYFHLVLYECTRTTAGVKIFLISITNLSRLPSSDEVNNKYLNSLALVRKWNVQTSDRRLSAKLVPTFADRGCLVVSTTDPHGRILGFLDRSRYYFFQVAPQLYSGGWVNPVPDPLLLRKSGSAGNRTPDLWICSQELSPIAHTRLDLLINFRFIYVAGSVRTR